MTDLLSFRRQIDRLDDDLIDLLSRRFEIIRAVGTYKRHHGIPAVLPERITEVRARCAARAAVQGLDPAVAAAVYDAIIAAACRLEDDIIRSGAC